MKTNLLKSVVAHFLCAALVLASTLSIGCKTVGVYDPVKTAAVKDSIQSPVQEAITRIIRNSPQHSDQIAGYFRAVGTVFCKMRDTGTFDSTFLLNEVDKATAGLQAGLDPLAITAKNTALALYTGFWGMRLRAELPADKFMWNVSDLFCKAIDVGLKDAGKPGTTGIFPPLPPALFSDAAQLRQSLASAAPDQGGRTILRFASQQVPPGAVEVCLSGDLKTWTAPPISVPWNGGTFTIVDYDTQDAAKFYRISLR